MKGKIILPLEKQPPILIFNCHASYLSILFTVRDYYKYFYSDFINIFSDSMSSVSGFLMERWYCDDMFFDMFVLTSDDNFSMTDCFGENIQGSALELLRKDNLVKSIKLMLDLGFYVSGRINEFYVPKRRAEGKYDKRHDFYLNGYDDVEKCFYLSGYTIAGRYETVDISYDNLVRGLTLKQKGTFNILNFCKLKDHYSFEIDVKKIKVLLEDFISARSSFEKPSGIFKDDISCFYFGSGVYDGLIKNIVGDNKGLDLRIFRMLLEHKSCMLKRFDVLGEAGVCIDDSIKNEYGEIAKLQALIFNLAMKYKLKPVKELLESISKKSKYIKDVEIKLLEKVILRLNEFV